LKWQGPGLAIYTQRWRLRPARQGRLHFLGRGHIGGLFYSGLFYIGNLIYIRRLP
jgi:hypothetical protein